MKRVIKNYCKYISDEDLIKLKQLIKKYNKCRNLFYNKYYNNIDIIFIQNRNKLKTKWNYLIANKLIPKEEYNLLRYTPEVMYKYALVHALNDLKILQQKSINICIRKINRNTNLSKDEKRYCIYILKSPNLIKKILNGNKITLDKYNNIDNKKLSNYIQRLLRKYKPKKPVAKSNTIILNLTLTKKEINFNRNRLILHITSLQKRKPIKLHMCINNEHQLKGSVKLILKKNNKIELHKPISIKKCKIKYNKNKSYIFFSTKHLIITDSNHYGLNISKEIYKIQSKINKHKEFNETFFINIKRIINESINKYINTEKPKHIITPNLNRSFMILFGMKFNKVIINYLQKYICKVLEYKTYKYNIKLSLVNEAYIEKACSNCFSLETKITAQSFECLKCTSHISFIANVLLNIKNYDGISLNLPHSLVKRVLEHRHNKIMSCDCFPIKNS